MVAVSDGGDGIVRLYRGRDLAPARTVALGPDADNLRVDSANGNFLVAYGEGGLAIIGPIKRRKVADVVLSAHPESFQLDPASGRVFANVPSAGEIAVIDPERTRQITRWRVPGLFDNFPMALDHAGQRLAVVFRRPPQLVLLDARTGAGTARLPACGDADDVWFDARRRRAVDIFQGAAGTRAAGRIATARGARTSLFVPALDRLYVAVPAASAGAGARVPVFRPSP